MASRTLVTRELVKELRQHFILDWNGIHGASHWARVRQNGLMLAEMTGANTKIIEAFAFVHDACRQHDGSDPDHGPRAADYARWLVKAKRLSLEPDELESLVVACAGHSEGRTAGDITVCTCWDADRLDLGRVGVRPDPERLCTEAARSPEVIFWAYRRSI